MPRDGLSGDRPAGRAVGEAEGEEPAQVDRGGPVVEPVVVLGDASVTESPVASGQPGDAAFDHGTVLPVGALEAVFAGPLPVAALQRAEVIAGANPVTFQDTGSAYMALQQNKVVGLVTNTMTAIKLVNQAGESGVQLALAKEPMALEPIGAGMRLGEPAFLHKVNEALASMEASGEIDAIWDRWIGPNTPYKMVREDKVQSLADLKFDPLP